MLFVTPCSFGGTNCLHLQGIIYHGDGFYETLMCLQNYRVCEAKTNRLLLSTALRFLSQEVGFSKRSRLWL